MRRVKFYELFQIIVVLTALFVCVSWIVEAARGVHSVVASTQPRLFESETSGASYAPAFGRTCGA